MQSLIPALGSLHHIPFLKCPSRAAPVSSNFGPKAAQVAVWPCTSLSSQHTDNWPLSLSTTPHLEEGSWAKLGAGRDAHVLGQQPSMGCFPENICQQAVARLGLEDVGPGHQDILFPRAKLGPWHLLSLSSPRGHGVWGRTACL